MTSPIEPAQGTQMRGTPMTKARTMAAPAPASGALGSMNIAMKPLYARLNTEASQRVPSAPPPSVAKTNAVVRACIASLPDIRLDRNDHRSQRRHRLDAARPHTAYSGSPTGAGRAH